jgi:UDP-N-acetylglucosamine 2-epimerase (non-hydrolysing)
MKAVIAAGTRPNFVKVAPLLEAAKAHPGLAVALVHTGQHYDYEMSHSFFEQLGIREPDVFLGAGSGTHGEQTAKVIEGFEKVVEKIEPEIVVVVGDVNSTLACALAASKVTYAAPVSTGLRRPLIAHVESGLRSFDRGMPEEINRTLTDSLSDILFTSCRGAEANLLREGVPREKIRFVGNVMIDTLLARLPEARPPRFLGGAGGGYGLLTLHRPSNVDEPSVLRGIIEALCEIAAGIPIFFPAHPRTQKRIAGFGLGGRLHSLGEGGAPRERGLQMLDPLPYLEFAAMVKGARIVFTDSGGIQEETTVFGVPCLTLRENTERPVTVEVGTNIVVGTSRERIVREAGKILRGEVKRGSVPELWDGRAAGRIMEIVADPPVPGR